MGLASAVTIRDARDSDASSWDRFVFASATGTFFHRFGWRRIFREIFRSVPHYLIAERDGHITGILPLVYQNSFLFGKSLSAAPFCVEGGPIAADAESLAALDQAAIALMDQTQSPFLEYRSRLATHEGWTVKGDLYASFSRPISTDDKENLLAIPRKQRAVVRKTLETTLTGEVDPKVDRFFAIYAESVRNLGTPVFPKRYFKALQREFGSDCDIVLISDRGITYSAVMNFYFKDTVLPYYGGGTSAARGNGANDLMYFEVIRRAAAKGYKRFDFGRSKAGTGAFSFKKNWGFEPEFLQYEYYLKPGTSLPEKNPNNPKFALLIATWKKLPLPIANFLGQFIIASLG